ncbi:hypothetical protein CBF34_09400 [Vagococcus penaei]|nr:YlbF family regulator [Vagococcus penaei]RST99056.1 hypothetical protein CBF34_09400 [Vagococcus penaei]
MTTISYDYEDNVKKALARLIESLNNHDTIKAYQAVEQRIDQHEGLKKLVDEIKQHQKEAVAFAHYDKPVAEQEALRQANAKQKEFDNHPLVIDYRDKLVEANDLLQHLTHLLETEVNSGIEERLIKK